MNRAATLTLNAPLLMLVAALVMFANVAIWLVPVK